MNIAIPCRDDGWRWRVTACIWIAVARAAPRCCWTWLGDSSATWALVQPQVANFTRVCSYDRPGLGWSDPSSGPRDSVHVAALVEDLLKTAHVEGPLYSRR